MKKIKKLYKVFIALVVLLCSPFAHALNINTATANEISNQLKGIGEVKAEAIVEYRNKNGDFKSIEDLLNVKGIGPKTLDNLPNDITFSETENNLDQTASQ